MYSTRSRIIKLFVNIVGRLFIKDCFLPPSILLLWRDNAFKLRLELLIGSLEELNFFRVLLFLNGPLFGRAFLDLFAFRLQLVHLSFEIFLFLLQFFDFGFHVGFSLLRLQRLSHAKGDAGFVERLVGRDGHANLVSNAKEKKPAFRAVDRYLPDQFIEALRVEFPSDGADASFSRLPLLQSHVKLLLKVDDVQARGRCRRHFLDP